MGGGLNIGHSNTNDLRFSDDEEEEGKECEEGDDISDSEINQYKEAVYKLLKFRAYKIRSRNGELRCPFCVGVEKQEYHRLLEHSIRVGEGSTESGKQRASHFAMAKYLVIDLPCEDKTKRYLGNNQMAEKLREAEENYRGLVEKLKENEVAMSKLEDICRHSILKEKHRNEELEEVRLELIKKDLRNNEMGEKLREAEENYGGLVKRLEEKEIALCKINEDASSTVVKLREVKKICLQLQQDLQSTEEKLSHLENENDVLRLKTLDESPTPYKFVASLSGGVSDSCRTKLGIEKHQRALRNNQMAEKLREAEENYRELVEKFKRKEVALSNSDDVYQHSKVRQSNDEPQEVRLDLIKRDLRNNQMAEKLKEVAENYRGLVENLKEKEVALSNLEDMYQRSILKEQHSKEELKEVRLELIKKDLRNSEIAEKLRDAEESYGGLESSLTALAEKNAMLECELAQAKEDATSTVAKLREVKNKVLQSMNEKMSNLEGENQVLRQKTLNELPNPSKLSEGFSDSHRTKSGIEKHQGNLEILSRCIKENLGFKDGKPIAAYVIYNCLLHWHGFQSESAAIFDFIFGGINDILKEGDENATLPYWLSNTSALVCLLHRNLRRGPESSFKYHGLETEYSALLFKQQLSASVWKIFGLIRDNSKKQISPLLGKCIQAPKTRRFRQQSPSNEWDSIIKFLDLLISRLRENHVPSFFTRKLTTQVFSFVNMQLFNRESVTKINGSLLLRRVCCTFSNGEYLKSGLAKLEKWITNATEEFTGTSWHELNYIRQAVGFLVIPQKRRLSLEAIRQDLCPNLTVRQIYRISTMYWDDKYGAQSVSNKVVSEMRETVSKDSHNLSPSNSLLLHDDLSIPFSTEEVYTAIPTVDPSVTELPNFFF